MVTLGSTPLLVGCEMRGYRVQDDCRLQLVSILAVLLMILGARIVFSIPMSK